MENLLSFDSWFSRVLNEVIIIPNHCLYLIRKIKNIPHIPWHLRSISLIFPDDLWPWESAPLHAWGATQQRQSKGEPCPWVLAAPTREVQMQIDGGNTKQKIMNAMRGAEKKCGAGGFWQGAGYPQAKTDDRKGSRVKSRVLESFRLGRSWGSKRKRGAWSR